MLQPYKEVFATNTIILNVDPTNPDEKTIKYAADVIRNGGLVAFPTETVYGLGVDALNSTAITKLFEAKKRPLDNPPIIHIADIKSIYPLVTEVTKKAELLMNQFWPGPLTLIFKHSKKVPKTTVAGLNTVAIRMPNTKVALELIKHSGCPIAAPSANLAGKPSPTSAQHVYEDLNERIDLILDGGSTSIGVESTVVDLTSDPPILLRPGGTPLEALKKVITNLQLHPFVQAEQELKLEKTSSPGMKHKHYAPKATVILIEGNIQAIINKTRELTHFYKLKGLKVGILATDETKSEYECELIESIGSRFNLPIIAKNLFRLLREVDAKGVDIIIAESVPSEGLGLAVMNRLRKASGYNIVKAE